MLKTIALTLLAGASMASLSGDKAWKATLAARGGSEIEGTADVKAMSADSTAMDIEIKKATASTTYAWHMHNGNCAANGSVVGAPNAYPVLKTDDKGSGEVEVTLALPALAPGEYSVHVHAPSADTAAVGMTVACGDLKPAGGDLKPGGGQ